MPASSVKLPELRQDIKVDTKDLDKAIAAAKRFKTAMNRELRGNYNLTVDVKGDLTRLREQLAKFKGRVQAEVSGDLKRLREQLKTFRGRVSAEVNGDLKKLRADLKAFRGEITVVAKLDTKALRAELASLTGGELKFDADISRALAKLAELRTAVEALTGPTHEIRVVIRGDVDRVLTRLRRSLADTTRDTRLLGDATSAIGSIMSATASVVSGFASALGGLAVGGTVAGGIGVLGSTVIGLGAALGGATPAVLGLTGAFGGLAVSIGGLKAIFTSNEGLEPAVESLKQAFQGIQDDLQARVNPSIIRFLDQVKGLAPIVRAAVPAFAAAFTELADQASATLRNSAFQNDLRLILESGIRQFRTLGEAGITAFRGIIGLAAETGPFVERVSGFVLNLSREFEAWVAEGRKTGEINRLMERAGDILISLGGTVANLIVGFKQLFDASNVSGFTDAVLQALSGISGDFRRFTAENEGLMQAMFANLARNVEGLRPLFASIADGIRVILTGIDLRPLMSAIQAIIPQLAAGLTEAANAAARLAAEAVPAIQSLLDLARQLIPDAERIGTAFLRNVVPAIDAVRPGIERLGEMLARISEDVLPVLGGGLRNLGAAASELVRYLAPVGELIGSMVGLLGDMGSVAGIALSALLGFAALRGIFGGAAGGAARLSQGLRNLATGTTASGRQVGILGGAVRGVLRPFAQATLGAGAFARGLVGLRGQMQVQAALARAYGTSLTGLGRAHAALITSQSGVLRGMGAMIGSYNTAQGAVRGFSTGVAGAASRVTAAMGRGMVTPVTASLRGLGFAVSSAGQGLRDMAGTAAGAGRDLARGLGGALVTAGGAMTRFGATITSAAGIISSGLGRAVGVGVGALGRLGSVAGGVAAAGVTAASRAVAGLSGALGGPWGVAITGAIAALSIMGQRSQETAQHQQALRSALDQSGGAIDANVVKTVQARLEQDNLAAASEALGVSMSTLAQSVAEGGTEYEGYMAQLESGLGYFPEWLSWITDISAATGNDTAQRRQALYAMREEHEQIRIATEARRAAAEQATRNAQSMTAEQQAAQNVAQGFDKMRQSAGDARGMVDGLSQALDGISGRSASADEANKRFGESLRQMGQAAQQGAGQVQILNGDLDEQSEAGGRAYDAVSQLREATLQKAAADFRAAGGTSNLGAAQDAANRTIQQGKQAMVESLTQMTGNREEAQRYADQLFAIPPEVLTRILADPANAERIVEEWRRGVTNAPPVPHPVGANPGPMEAIVAEAKRRIEGAPPTPAPVGADPKAFDEAVKRKMEELKNAPPAPAPVGGNTQPLDRDVGFAGRKIEGQEPFKAPVAGDVDPLDKDVGTAQGNIEGAPPAALPVGGNLIVEQEVLAFVGRLNAFPGAILPIGANVQPGEAAALGWVARINAFPGAALPINANVVPGEQQALAWVGRINAFPGAALPINANIDPLNQAYNQAFTFITSNVMFVPLGANIDQLNQQYNEAFTFITGNVMVAPVAGDFTQLINEYQRIVNQIQSTPITIPIMGQFMGIAGLGFGAGGIVGNARGNLFDAGDLGSGPSLFADGGMNPRDKATLKALAGTGQVELNDTGRMSQTELQRAMGLSPMPAGQAQIVAPNTWRVVGDRPVDDEAYIPINRSMRSQMLLAETAKRMGYHLEKLADGGYLDGGDRRRAGGGGESGGGSRGGDTYNQSTTNTTEAPMVGGDLNIVVPRDTPVDAAFAEANFELRRMRRGGVHRRTRVAGAG